MREFHLGDVISITTGRFMSPRGMEGIRDIIGFIVGSSSEVTDMGCVLLKDRCSDALLRQHPNLAALNGLDASQLQAWIEAQPVKTLPVARD